MSIVRFMRLGLLALWRGLDTLRRVLHLIVLLPLLVILLAALVGDRRPLPDGAALVIAPSGFLVEQMEGDPLDRALRELQGTGPRQTSLKDLLDSLAAAATDDRIRLVVLQLDQLQGADLAKLQMVGAALRELRAAGKPVIAAGSGFTQEQYYLAAHADEILMHELGVVYLEGYGYYRTFFRGALENLLVDLNVFRVGEYKSFVEPWTRDDMSSEDREASRRWLAGLWQAWLRDVAAARGMPADQLGTYADRFAGAMERTGGDAARVALDSGLVDRLLSRPAMERRIAERLTGDADADADFPQVDFRDYLAALALERKAAPAAGEIGVIVASGVIVDGSAAPGTVGGDSLAGLIRQAADDDSISAVVLRIDSPGGSMFASEVIAAEIDRLQSLGKPLVASMGGLAASGGYYIAMPADEIWAAETTITGSIGVGAIFPTVQRGLARLGITVDGLGTTALSGQLRPDRELSPEARRILELSVQDAYRVFVDKVARYRGMSFERADNLARGRVWSGADALELGLVDSLGGLDQAIAAAAARAGLEEGDYRVRYIEPELSFSQRLALQFAGSGLRLARALGLAPEAGPVLASAPVDRLFSGLRRQLDAELRDIAALNDPRGIYLHCFCTAPFLAY